VSWWKTGTEQFEIGDVPADKIASGLKKIAAAKRQNGMVPPTLSQLLGALGLALQLNGPTALFAETSRETVSAEGSNDPDLTAGITKTVDEVKGVYETELGRPASIGEILACFSFVLGYKPETFLSDAEGAKIKKIAVEQQQEGTRR
jgi:hypothetical protein